MIRIASRNLDEKKKMPFALSPIKGIGKSNVNGLLAKVYEEANANLKNYKDLATFKQAKLGDLSEEVLVVIRNIIDRDYLVEDNLRRQVQTNVNRLMDLNTWRGIRHKTGMAVRGQRTRKNMKTRRKTKRI